VGGDTMFARSIALVESAEDDLMKIVAART